MAEGDDGSPYFVNRRTYRERKIYSDEEDDKNDTESSRNDDSTIIDSSDEEKEDTRGGGSNSSNEEGDSSELESFHTPWLSRKNINPQSDDKIYRCHDNSSGEESENENNTSASSKEDSPEKNNTLAVNKTPYREPSPNLDEDKDNNDDSDFNYEDTTVNTSGSNTEEKEHNPKEEDTTNSTTLSTHRANNSPFANRAINPPSSINTCDGKGDNDKENKEEEGKQPAGFLVGFQFRKLVKQLYEQQYLLERYGSNLPDRGDNIKRNIGEIHKRMIHLRGYVPSPREIQELLAQPVEDDDSRGKAGGQPNVIKGVNVYAQAKMLTHGAVADLHSALASRPSEDTLADNPSEIKVSLMKHQRSGLMFLLWREEQIPRGGILADDMGLGKTLSMISLILHTKRERPAVASPKSSDCSFASAGTLVVAPLTLLKIWEDEINSKVYPGHLSVFVYHGPRRPKDPRELLHYDVVVTTYTLIGMEGEAHESKTQPSMSSGKGKRTATPTLFEIHWNRVILDEAHTIRNPKSGISKGCCALYANYRWAITGTPVQNKLQDFYSLIKFLRLAPFNDLKVWKDTIEGKGLGMKRLQTMVSGLVLRRVKEELDSIKLPEKTVRLHSLKLSEEEQKVYNVLFHYSRGFFMKYLHEMGEDVELLSATGPTLEDLMAEVPFHLTETVQSVMKSMLPVEVEMQRPQGTVILVLLLRLRQACNHFHLLSTALSNSTDEDTDGLSDALASLSLHQHDKSSPALPDEFEQNHISTKVDAIISTIKEIVTTDVPGSLPNKCIIVSQWTSMLGIIEHHLIQENISFTKIDGKVNVKDRQLNISSFNSSSRNPRVMLLSLTAGGVGLTLTAANHLFIVDLHWNPQLEQQASDRCHRVGQTRDVIIHRFMMENTVETIISLIQSKKLKLATDVLDGSSTKSKKASMKLTLQDLKLLFEVS